MVLTVLILKLLYTRKEWTIFVKYITKVYQNINIYRSKGGGDFLLRAGRPKPTPTPLYTKSTFLSSIGEYPNSDFMHVIIKDY